MTVRLILWDIAKIKNDAIFFQDFYTIKLIVYFLNYII